MDTRVSPDPEPSASGTVAHDATRKRLVPYLYFAILLFWPLLIWLRSPGDPYDLAWMIEAHRLGAYTISAILLWVIFLVVAVAQWLTRAPWRELGIVAPRWRDLAFAVLFLLVSWPLLGGLNWMLEMFGLGLSDVVVQALLPETAAEKWAWVGLSVTAAVSEEFCFRGFLLTHGTSILRSRWPAAIVSAAAFGIGHLYQGWGGVVLVFIFGILFTILRFWTGSLWACVLAHALQDIAAMYLAPLQGV